MRNVSLSGVVTDVLYNLLFVLSAVETHGVIFIWGVVGDTKEMRTKRVFPSLHKVVAHLFITVRISRCSKFFISHTLPCCESGKRLHYIVIVSYKWNILCWKELGIS